MINMKLSKRDMIGITFLIAVIVFCAFIVYYRPNVNCEVARPEYKCTLAIDVMREHCEYWAKYKCNTSADVSLEQIEWYIKNLCEIHNKHHKNKLDCANLAHACNQATKKQLCP